MRVSLKGSRHQSLVSPSSIGGGGDGKRGIDGDSTKEKLVGKVNATHFITTLWVLNRSLSAQELDTVKKSISAACKEHGLTCTSPDKTHLSVTGQAKGFSALLKVEIYQYTSIVQACDTEGTRDLPYEFHATMEDLSLYAEWEHKVENIFGLDTVHPFKPYFHQKSTKKAAVNAPTEGDFIGSRGAALKTSFTPLELAKLYNFPDSEGAGQKVGIIQLGGGFTMTDLNAYFSKLGITGITPNVTAVTVGGGTNNPGDPSGASVEVILDTEIIMALVPRAAIYVFFAPNTFKGFYDAFSAAMNLNCGVISCSWGLYERGFGTTNLSSYNALFATAATKNISIFCAAGDNGSSDGTTGLNVDFPGSSPYAISCGGTRLSATSAIDPIVSEVVWNNNSTTSATGGGLSYYFSKPDYQSAVAYDLTGKRGVPDVSANADPQTGYELIYKGATIIVGGTSAVSPLLSALTTRLNQLGGKTQGFLHPRLYAASGTPVFRDIVAGNNGAYTAGAHWDPASGLGVINGKLLLEALISPTLSPAEPPVASFTLDKSSGVSPLTVIASDTSTNSPTSWLWECIGFTSQTTKNATFTFANAGTYSISLTATNAGGSNSTARSITVTAPLPPTVAPVVSWSLDKTSGVSPLTVTCTDTSSNAPTSWEWTCAGFTSLTTKNASFTFTTAGTYPISHTATNAGGSTTSSKTVTVTVPPPPSVPLPVASFTLDKTTGTAPLTVTCTDTSTNSPSTWLWSFYSGATLLGTSNLKNASWTFVTAGVSSVTLKVGNITGLSQLASTTVTVQAAPAPIVSVTANFNASQTKNTLKVQFTDTSKGGVNSWLWDFGNGKTSLVKNPLIIFEAGGAYTVTLTARNAGGQEGSLTKKVIVSTPFKSIFSTKGGISGSTK